ncbi:MAG TPA: DUF899 family protein [Dongiaceae bacterium]|nr:DUF899 family protein [Dongiaceae bacterium]
MKTNGNLKPAGELAKFGYTYPNESAEYRRARTALLAEEIELRRHIERVAEQRRALPLGGEVPEDYRFESENGPVRLSEMFGKHDTLVVYNYMYGPQRKRPCPMCTSLLSAWDGEAEDVGQRVALAVVAKSPIERLKEFKKERGWRHLKLYSSAGNSFNRDYHAEGPESDDDAAINVFVKRNGRIHHFWGGEMTGKTADPGQDPRGAPDLMPIWTILDMTPAGRGTDWYPQLDYDK